MYPKAKHFEKTSYSSYGLPAYTCKVHQLKSHQLSIWRNSKEKSLDFKIKQRKCVCSKKESMITLLQEEALNTDRKCPSCSKFFLCKGSFAGHIGCKTCTRSENPREKRGEIEAALKAQAVGIAATICNLGSERRKENSKEDKL